MASNEQHLAFVPAPHGVRVLAGLADGLFLLTVVAALPQPIRPLWVLVLFVAYHTILISLIQQTLGKAQFGLKIVRLAKKPGLLWAFGRTSFGYFFVDVLGLGLVAALFDRQRRTLHDFAFGSL